MRHLNRQPPREAARFPVGTGAMGSGHLVGATWAVLELDISGRTNGTWVEDLRSLGFSGAWASYYRKEHDGSWSRAASTGVVNLIEPNTTANDGSDCGYLKSLEDFCVPCNGLDDTGSCGCEDDLERFLGRCNESVAEWCADGRHQAVDCASTGQLCTWIDGELGYSCR